ncbi:MAG TPA: response regulator [Methanoregula sp.]|nr:response regulator [Methanoregula sp.]
MTGESILIIEDDGIVAFHLQEMLKRAGYCVEDPVASEKDALDRLARLPPPDIVLVNAGEPALSPHADAVRTFCSDRNIPVLVLTPFEGACGARMASAGGLETFLAKPFRDTELLPAVEKALRSRDPAA